MLFRSYRSNPLGLAEYTLSRKDPEYVGKAKEIQKVEAAREDGTYSEANFADFANILSIVKKDFPKTDISNTGVGSTIYAVKPGDGSAREQAASCQKVLGGWANIAHEYATKRYRSNLINWGMLPFLLDLNHEELPFTKDDYIFIPDVVKAVQDKLTDVKAFVVKEDGLKEFNLKLGELTDDEREIILKGCLINFNRR